MDFLVTKPDVHPYANKELQKATNRIFELGNAIKKNWFAIAYTVAQVDAKECYKDDGYNTVHEWVTSTFGLKKTASYSLLAIGKEYTRAILNSSGKVVGYGTNLITEGPDDFSKTQVERMLPGGHDLALELVQNGEITPSTPAKEISRIVKQHTAPEDEQAVDETSNDKVETEQDDERVSVWDKEGNEYLIPVNILNKYAIIGELS